MTSQRFLTAARQILDNDDSIDAARSLELILLDDYQGDERFEDLLYALSMYSPGRGHPYFGANDLRKAVQTAVISFTSSE